MVWHYESSHAEIKRFGCGKIGCPKTFSSVYTLKRHYQDKHQTSPSIEGEPSVVVSNTLDDEMCPDEEMSMEEDPSDNEFLLDSIIDIDAVKRPRYCLSAIF